MSFSRICRAASIQDHLHHYTPSTLPHEARISLATSHTFPLERFQEAMQVVLQRRSLGRVVVLPEARG